MRLIFVSEILSNAERLRALPFHGAGEQDVNKTRSIRRWRARSWAWSRRLLRPSILLAEREHADDAGAADRKSEVGSGDRSQRLRTNNFPQGRVTDHRIN